MLMEIIKIVTITVLLHYAMEYRIWSDWDKKIIHKNRPGSCKVVVPDGGSEDVTSIGDNIVLFSSGFSAPVGKINALNLNDSSVFEVNISNPPDLEDFMLTPHGIYVWTEPSTGHMTLFVVTHPKKGDRIEVFDILKPLALKHRKSITDVKFGSMNDLIAIDSDRFYITQMFHYTDPNIYTFEFLARLKWGKVMFYDGKRVREVVSNLCMPNGINMSPDKQAVYVAEFGSKKLLGYRRDSTNNLIKIWENDMNTAMDNIEVDPNTGDLWIGCHPLIFPIMDEFGLSHVTPPSQVLNVKMTDNMVDRVEEVYTDDGSEAIGTSSATYVDGRIVIGTVYNQLVVCDTSVKTYA